MLCEKVVPSHGIIITSSIIYFNKLHYKLIMHSILILENGILMNLVNEAVFFIQLFNFRITNKILSMIFFLIGKKKIGNSDVNELQF